MSEKSADLEETIRFNTEQRLIAAGAPDKWKELKQYLVSECERMPRFAPLQLDIQQTECQVRVDRIEKGLKIKELTLEYDPSVPRIVWICRNPFRPGDGSIFFRFHNGSVVLVQNNVVQYIPDLVVRLTSCITG